MTRKIGANKWTMGRIVALPLRVDYIRVAGRIIYNSRLYGRDRRMSRHGQ